MAAEEKNACEGLSKHYRNSVTVIRNHVICVRFTTSWSNLLLELFIHWHKFSVQSSKRKFQKKKQKNRINHRFGDFRIDPITCMHVYIGRYI